MTRYAALSTRDSHHHRLTCLLRAVAGALCVCSLLASDAVAANTEDSVVNGQADLTQSATYSGGSPTTSSDVTFLGSTTYSPTAFALNTSAFNLNIGTLDDLDTTQTLTIDNTFGSGASTITLNGGGDSVAQSSSDLFYVASGGTLSIGAASTGTLNLALAASGNFDIAGTANIGSAISGTGFGFTLIGGGTLSLSGANTYTGPTTINSGTLRLGVANAVQNSTVSIGAANALTFSPSIGTFTLGGLSGSANELLADTNSVAVTLQVGNNNASTVYSGALSGVGGALTKIGSGTLSLTSSLNTYSGPTTINAGTLQIGMQLVSNPGPTTPSMGTSYGYYNSTTSQTVLLHAAQISALAPWTTTSDFALAG